MHFDADGLSLRPNRAQKNPRSGGNKARGYTWILCLSGILTSRGGKNIPCGGGRSARNGKPCRRRRPKGSLWTFHIDSTSRRTKIIREGDVITIGWRNWERLIWERSLQSSTEFSTELKYSSEMGRRSRKIAWVCQCLIPRRDAERAVLTRACGIWAMSTETNVQCTLTDSHRGGDDTG